MDRLISCEFNMDTACVELKFADGSMIAIDTIAVENEIADNMYQRSELDYLIYNDPIGYADLILDVYKRQGVCTVPLFWQLFGPPGFYCLVPR